ncbi:hypothetical protein ACXWQS_09370, partial [Streptococcus pyogenes]
HTTSLYSEDAKSNAKISKEDNTNATASNSDEDGSESESDSGSESEREEAINVNDPEEKRLRAERRIITRQKDAEKGRTLEHLRAAVVCVLG